MGVEELDGDVAEGGVAQVAGDVGEAAAAEVDVAVFEDEVDFGFVTDRVNDIGVAEGDEDVVVIVLVELGIGMGSDFDIVGAEEGVFNLQVMVGFAGNIAVRQRRRGLGVQRECEHEQTGAEKQVQSEPPQKQMDNKASRSQGRFLSTQADLPRERKVRKCVGLLRSK